MTTHKTTRREFFEESMIAAGIAAASQASSVVAQESILGRSAVNDTIRHAVIGCRIRGRVHAKEFAAIPGVEVAYVCDPDRELCHQLATAVAEQTGKRPVEVSDLRTILDDSAVDTVSIAAPNHWHALASVWAMQAGKDVYVEKPVSHNVTEGRRIVQAARKLGRICQAGTQNRSRGDLAAAAQFIRDGGLGHISHARTIVYGRRGSIGPQSNSEIPDHIDLNLWLGPATQQQITRPNLHYDWHWVWDTGNGELGNNNIHYVDICRWLLGIEGLGQSVMSLGGRWGYDDAGETPNTQIVVHQFGDGSDGRSDSRPSGSNAESPHPLTIIQEVRGLPSDPFSKHFKAGHVIYGSEGIIAEGSLFDHTGRLSKTFAGPGVNHFQNFIDAVRTRKPEQLRADIEEGHQSTSLCHIGNISYRLGKEVTVPEAKHQISQLNLHPKVSETFNEMLAHLRAQEVDLSAKPLVLGPLLEIANSGESFIDRADANELLVRKYRPPFVLPQEHEI